MHDKYTDFDDEDTNLSRKITYSDSLEDEE